MTLGRCTTPALEEWLKADTANVRVLQAELNRLPQVWQVLGRDGHCERDWKLYVATALDSANASSAEVCAAQGSLAFELRTVELQIELDAFSLSSGGEVPGEGFVGSDADAIGVEEQVIDSGITLDPIDQFEKLRMKCWLAAGELQDFNAALLVNHILNTALYIRQRNRINFRVGTNRRIRIARGAGEITGVDDFDECETGGKFFKCGASCCGGVATECSSNRIVRSSAG